MLVCDVGPRDGLQNDPVTLPPAARAELVNRLAAAGLPRVEAVSFVQAGKVPQMSGAEEVVAALDRGAGAELAGLVLNERGDGIHLGVTLAVAFGCPFEGAVGAEAVARIATEDLVYLLHGMGVATGVDLDRLLDCSAWLEEQLGHDLPGQVRKVGSFTVA